MSRINNTAASDNNDEEPDDDEIIPAEEPLPFWTRIRRFLSFGLNRSITSVQNETIETGEEQEQTPGYVDSSDDDSPSRKRVEFVADDSKYVDIFERLKFKPKDFEKKYPGRSSKLRIPLELVSDSTQLFESPIGDQNWAALSNFQAYPITIEPDDSNLTVFEPRPFTIVWDRLGRPELELMSQESISVVELEPNVLEAVKRRRRTFLKNHEARYELRRERLRSGFPILPRPKPCWKYLVPNFIRKLFGAGDPERPIRHLQENNNPGWTWRTFNARSSFRFNSRRVEPEEDLESDTTTTVAGTRIH